MKVLVIGATGPLGREILKQTKAKSFAVTALARKPGSLAGVDGVEVVEGDVFDIESLKRAMTGVDLVISAYGLKLTRKPTTRLSEGTKNMLEAMKATRVPRLICVTGNGAGDSKGHGGFFFNRILEPLLLHEMYKDKTRQEDVIRKSDLDWTIVRPAVLTNGPLTGSYRAVTNLSDFNASKISRNDVAGFIVNEIENRKFREKSVTLSY